MQAIVLMADETFSRIFSSGVSSDIVAILNRSNSDRRRSKVPGNAGTALYNKQLVPLCIYRHA